MYTHNVTNVTVWVNVQAHTGQGMKYEGEAGSSTLGVRIDYDPGDPGDTGGPGDIDPCDDGDVFDDADD